MISTNEQSSTLGPIIIAVSVVFTVLGAGAWFLSTQEKDSWMIQDKPAAATEQAAPITARERSKTPAV